jgi:hypothetical protein
MEINGHQSRRSSGVETCFLVVKRSSLGQSLQSSQPPLAVESLDGDNWIDFDATANEFLDTMQHAQPQSPDHDDDNSSIPLGSHVDIGAPLTDEEDFAGSPNLDSEWIDDLSSLERMKEILGQGISQRTTEFLSRPQNLSKVLQSRLSDDDTTDASLESDILLVGQKKLTGTSHSSKSSGMTASTVLMYADKPHKSKKSKDDKRAGKDDKKKKKKKKKSKSRKDDDSVSSDDGFPSYEPLGDLEDSLHVHQDSLSQVASKGH